jgi:hypothetical protein
MHFVAVCLCFLAFSIIALALGLVRFKLKVCFWLDGYTAFKVGLMWKPGVATGALQKAHVEGVPLRD